jgi:ERCC4-related helicase
MDGDETPIRVTTSKIEEMASEYNNISEWQIRRKVRYHGKYVNQMYLDAVQCLDEKNITDNHKHQMIVFAMTVAHAKVVAEMFNTIRGEKRFADYIGVLGAIGDDQEMNEVAGRPEKENRRIIREFKEGRFPCLVQVAKAGVGFNVPEVSVIVMMNALGDGPLRRQFIGRGLRVPGPGSRFGGTPINNVLDLFVSADMPDLDALMDMSMEIEGGKNGPPGGGGGGGLLEIPVFSIIDVNKIFECIVFPLGGIERSVERAMPLFRERLPERFAGIDDDGLRDAIRDIMREEMDAAAEKNRPLAVERQLAQAQANVKSAMNLVVSNAIKLIKRQGVTFERSLVGDMKRALNKFWISSTNGKRHDDMTVEDFIQKYRWLQSVNERMLAEKEVPVWLNL